MNRIPARAIVFIMVKTTSMYCRLAHAGLHNEHQLPGRVIIINGDGGCRIYQSTDGFMAQVYWLGLRVGGRLALFNVHQVNGVNSRDGYIIVTAL